MERVLGYYHKTNDERDMTYQREGAINRLGEKINLFDYETLEYIDSYNSYSLAEEDLGISPGSIRSCMKRLNLPGILTGENAEYEYIFSKKDSFEENAFMHIFKIDSTFMEMKFALKRGFVVTREGWENEYAIRVVDQHHKNFHVDLEMKKLTGGTYIRRFYNTKQEKTWIVGVLK